MNLIEIFHEYLDHLYWDGYALFLKKEKPDWYVYELTEFAKIYS